MSETDRAPFIRLSVDQEVFIDTVRESDTIDDANVATEVTSFDRVGDAYVLEGAIVFAGYLTRSDTPPEPAEDEPDALSFGFDDGEYVQHVHHRMPFILRVPVKSQQRGIVNVASRIAGWKLSVISAGWIQVLADLNIVGLNGGDGYHFQCGAQEEGNVFFGKEWNDGTSSTASSVPLADEVYTAGQESSAPENDFQLTRGAANEPEPESPPERASEEEESTLQSKLDTLSAARGGHQQPESVPDEVGKAETEKETVAKDELVSLDRALHGTETKQPEPTQIPAQEPSGVPFFFPNSPVDKEEPLRGQDPEVVPSEEDSPQPKRSGAIAEFEFEHQVSSAELQAEGQSTPATESFVASRSFTEDGFHVTSGFVPTVTVSSQGSLRSEAGDDPSGGVNAAEEQYSDNASYFQGFAPVDKGLWSFVDLSVPERYFTLRYAIVMEEETLDVLSERLGCLKADLMRVNRMSSETVFPGQTLKIPHTKSVFTK